MQVDISGHHVNLTNAMKGMVDKKFLKCEKRFDGLGTVDVIIKVERNDQQIEAKTLYLGNRVSVSARDQDFYRAIDQAATKLSRALETRKGHIKAIGRERPQLNDEYGAELDSEVS